MAEQKNSVWLLCITHGIDDYKPRGRTADSTIKVFSSEEKAKNALKEKIFEEILDYDDLYVKLNNKIVKIYKSDGEQTKVKYIKNCKNLTKENHNDFKEELFNIFPIDELYERVAQGEFIPYRWTYEISEHRIIA